MLFVQNTTPEFAARDTVYSLLRTYEYEGSEYW